MKNNTPDKLLTIGITSYNYGHYIEDAVKSVINQTSPNWRLIIADNCSTDNTLKILQPYLQDSRVRLVVHEKNRGPVENGLFIINSIETKFFSYLQADDFLDATFVENALAQFDENPNAPFVFFDWLQYIDDSKTGYHHGRFPFAKNRSGPIKIAPYLTVCNFVPIHMAVFRTDCFRKAYDYLLASPLNQIGEQYLLKILEDEYGCGCYSGTMGGVWRRHGEQMTVEHMASSLAQIEEPLERHWYASKAPNPDHINVFLSLVAFIHLSSHERYMASVHWLLHKGARYTASFNVPVERERNRLLSVSLAVALKYTTFSSVVKFIDIEEIKTFLKEEMQCKPSFEGLKFVLESVRETETETFINAEEIQQICHAFFGEESSYNAWLTRHYWNERRCRRLKNSSLEIDRLPVIHFLLTVDCIGGKDQQSSAPSQIASQLFSDTINDLTSQSLSNWRLTVFSARPCPDARFASDSALEWIQISSSPTEAMTAVVETGPADWFFCAPVGVRLSPAFTLLAGLRLRHQPNALLLYADEDMIGKADEHALPKLKPDINLELLRSQPSYIGAAVLIHRSLLLDPRIAILPVGLSRNYGAALLALERDLAAIDHLDEILVHVPEVIAEEYTSAPLASVLLQQHLARCGVSAEIGDGPLSGTLFVDYKLPDQSPMVSIVMAPDQHRSDEVRSCLESLLAKTDYPNYEVLVIDTCFEFKLKNFLADLLERHSQVRVLSSSQKRHRSIDYNFAACQANGSFLLFMDSSYLILQQNWLTRLIGTGIRPEVGVVGCRLISAEQSVKSAGLVLGQDGVVGHIGMNLPLIEPGHMGRAQLPQTFSAVSGAGMLVRKDLFFQVDGFDQKDFTALFGDADLCLKIGAQGYQIVWTPFVTLAQQKNSDRIPEQNARSTGVDSRARKAFIKKWSDRLGDDPAYHRYLSLRQPDWVIDGDFDVPWHPDFEPLPRIIAQPPDEMGVGQYRVIGPIKALTQSERISSFMLPALNSDKRFLPSVPELLRAKPTVLFLQNAFSDLHFDHLQDYAELLPSVFRVCGQDDIVFAVPQKSAARKHFGKDTKARVRKAVSLCHRAIVTTEPIAEAMRGMVDDIRVVPNYLERSRWGSLQAPGNERRKPRVGWAGAQQHQGDLEFILPVVEATANEVDWIFMGMCPPKLRYHAAESHPAIAFDDYPAALAALDLDLAIAPLELNRFNAAKSNLRLLEYGAAGYPVIATDILPYQSAPVTRVPNNPRAWIEAIREHVHDLAAARVAGERLRQWVLSGWMLDQHLDEWLRALLPD